MERKVTAPCAMRCDALRAAWLAIAVVAVTTALSCGDSAPTHPDTGIGAGETAPGTPNCVDSLPAGRGLWRVPMQRGHHVDQVHALADQTASLCSVVCAGVQLPPVTATQWQCLYQQSCRQVFEHDVCGVGSTYSCM